MTSVRPKMVFMRFASLIRINKLASCTCYILTILVDQPIVDLRSALLSTLDEHT